AKDADPRPRGGIGGFAPQSEAARVGRGAGRVALLEIARRSARAGKIRGGKRREAASERKGDAGFAGGPGRRRHRSPGADPAEPIESYAHPAHGHSEAGQEHGSSSLRISHWSGQSRAQGPAGLGVAIGAGNRDVRLLSATSDFTLPYI